MKRFASICTLTTALLFSANTFASANINVNINLLTTCAISNIVNLGFTATTLANPASATGSFDLTCSSPTSNISVQFNNGLNPDVSNNRRLIETGSNTDFITYGLYSDAGHTTAITSTAIVLPGPVNATATSFAVYGLIPTNQQVPAGLYTDTITVLISY